jgi:asparagine synthase (glutamine-hydrolysing)
MFYAQGRLAIVFNGEIYNFRELRRHLLAAGCAFASDSDTEVVLAAYERWGTECLSRLNGMFALAIYDNQQRQLFLARDRAGEKPLYYALRNGAIQFASELKGLMSDRTLPRRVDRQSLEAYLWEGFVSGERCILRGVNKLPAAHALLFDLQNGTARTWRYWQLPPPASTAAGNDTAEVRLLEELEQLLEDSVRRQMLADVPVGILLSGGVDSSLVTAMAVRAAHEVKTFTVRFPGHARYDETEHARLIARHFGTQHMELEASDTTPQVLRTLARQFDEPLIDSSMIPTHMVSGLVREHCTVALGGDGGDELFGGYAHYDRLLRMNRALGWVPHFVRRPLATMAGAVLPVGFKGRNWLQGLGTDMRSDVPLIAAYFDCAVRHRLLGGRGEPSEVVQRDARRRLAGDGDLLDRSSRLDFQTYLPEDILVKVDRASMLHSLEVRAPMLDVRLIEFAFGKVPTSLKVDPSRRKILLKKLATRVLPPSFDLQRKQGFSIPLPSWLRSPEWDRYFREVLLDDGQCVFEHGFVASVLDGQSRGRANSERLFGLVMFELWRREYHAEIDEA